MQYGPRIASLVIYLLHYQLLPEDRLAELMADLFGVRLVAATIARMSRTCAARATVRDLVAGAAVKHMDETGLPDRRQDPMAACGQHRLAHLPPRLRQTRQPAGRCGRHSEGKSQMQMANRPAGQATRRKMHLRRAGLN